MLPARPSPRTTSVVVPVDEMLVLRDRHPNVMLVGSDAATSAALSEIHALLRQPITRLRAHRMVQLPTTLTQGTLILSDVGALTITAQHGLHEWLGRTCGGTQVVVTTTVPLLPSVARGSFLDVLYYRLNTVYLEVGALSKRV